jgi:hypothetical protein
MTLSAISNIIYSAAGGVTAGIVAGEVLTRQFHPIVAGRAFSYFPVTGVALGVVAAVGRVFDEVFKAAGWSSDPLIRKLSAHLVVGLLLFVPVSIIVGDKTVADTLVTLALTVSSLAINVLIE